MTRRARALALLTLTVTAAASCSGTSEIAVVLVAPDGGDPFYAPIRADHVRLWLEGQAVPEPLSVEPGGAFSLRLAPPAGVQSRLMVEALRGEQRVGSAASPPVDWSLLGGSTVRLLLHTTDALIPAPYGLGSPRAEFRLIESGGQYVWALTVPNGETASRGADVYATLPNETQVQGQQVPAVFDGESSVLGLFRSWLILRGDQSALFTGETSVGVDRTRALVPAERARLVASTAVADTIDDLGGGWLVGGRDVRTGEASARVDRVGVPDRQSLRVRFESAPSLGTPRAGAQIVDLVRPTADSAGVWLVVGGQTRGSSLIESYAVGSAIASRDLDPAGESARLGSRTDVAAVCIARDEIGCASVLVLGGRDESRSLDDGLLLDGACARRGGENCALARTIPALLASPRSGARAALAEGGRVLVVGGRREDGTPAYEPEIIDVSDPRQPRFATKLPALTTADPAVLALANGSVMVAGGRHLDGTAATEIWLYRH